jgi:hypothetical protein
MFSFECLKKATRSLAKMSEIMPLLVDHVTHR